MIAVPSLFGPSLAELPHTQLVFRAVESRAAMAMSDVAFSSAIVDAYGHVRELAITPQGAQAILVADVALGSGRTAYALLGDWLGWLSLVGLAWFGVWIPRTLRRAKGTQLADQAHTERANHLDHFRPVRR